jgi:hypothetical protein
MLSRISISLSLDAEYVVFVGRDTLRLDAAEGSFSTVSFSSRVFQLSHPGHFPYHFVDL